MSSNKLFYRSIAILFICSTIILTLAAYLESPLDQAHLQCSPTSCGVNDKNAVGNIATLLDNTFNTDNWPPRWKCGVWSGFQGWTSILSDFLIFISYMGIPLFLIYYLIRIKRYQMPFGKLLVLFVVFIISCGVSHLAEVIIFWKPIYNFAILAKLITAGVSFATLVALIYSMDEIIKLKGPFELQKTIDERTAELNDTNKRLSDEIERRQEYESSLKSALDNNEFLFSELHHRVKNNLQLVMNMLYLNFSDRPEVLREMNARIKSMSQVHDLLLQSKSINDISLQDYVRALMESLKHSLNLENLTFNLEIPSDILLTTEKGTILGLIIAEAFTNSAKYAFNDHLSPEISVLAERVDNNKLKIIIADNGSGFDPSGLKEKGGKIGGSQLIDTFISSLDGTIEMISSPSEGTQLIIRMPI